MRRKRIQVTGIVQGVGFRPFVYQQAHRHGLSGYVLNSPHGVTIEVEGPERAVSAFLERLQNEPPPLAQIREIAVTDLEPRGDAHFVIRDSSGEGEPFLLVPPDIATCDDCRRDFTDPANRRYLYPFTNCTNCGPRYTIIVDIPYDRPATTMAEFRMCPACQAEYDSPGDRRFHAQPNACPACGPSLSMPLPEIRELLRQGRILAIKGLGGFHLACDAENDAAVRRLRERKRRSDKPFALMAPDLAAVERFCEVTEAERRVLLSARRPIVILRRRPGARISPVVAPGNNTLGVMLPYTPLHYLLFDGFTALVMTSGNVSEEPIVSRDEEVEPRLGPLCDHYVLHNRKIQTRVDDSVVRVIEGAPRTLRRSRGYAPHPIDLGAPVPELLACGGELKNTFCLTKDRYAILSQHIGDLENYETLVFFRETLEHMRRFFRVTPRAAAHDLHPLYLSTKFALELDLEKVGVQHHHAHIAACMAENGLRGKVIGVAFDGTGYGTDGRIWGGEFLICDYAGFERRAHLRYVPLPGGDTAIRQPWRVAYSYLRETFGARLPDLPLFERAPARGIPVVETMIARRINTVETSSCGRLFDAVASILDLRHETNYEGQAAIELENLAAEGVEDSYPFEIAGGEIDVRPAIERIAREARAGDAPRIAARFHNTVVAVIAEVCRRLRAAEGLNRVCLSGGTFQNVYLLTRALGNLRQCGFEVYLHAAVPPNDGGLSLGQAVIAAEALKGR